MLPLALRLRAEATSHFIAMPSARLGASGKGTIPLLPLALRISIMGSTLASAPSKTA